MTSKQATNNLDIVETFIYMWAGLGLGLAIHIAWVLIARRFQKNQDLERDAVFNQNRESLLEVRKENEMLQQRIQKSESLESELRQLLKDSENEGAQLTTRVDELNRRLKEKEKEHEESAKWLQDKFENLANKILDQKSSKFTEINKENIKLVLQPLDKDIREFRKKVEDLHEKETSQHAALREFLGTLQQSHTQLSEEARNLTNALKGDSKKQGDWGGIYFATGTGGVRTVKRSGVFHAIQLRWETS